MSKKDEKLSAYFPGLVDVCEGEDGQLLFVTNNEASPVVQETAVVNACEVFPPDREQFPYTPARAGKVLKHFGRDDATIYQDVLSYLKRFSALDDLQWSIVAHYTPQP